MNTPIAKTTPAEDQADAGTLRQAAAVLKQHFGILIAGDLINALNASADLIDSQAGVSDIPEKQLATEDDRWAGRGYRGGVDL